MPNCGRSSRLKRNRRRRAAAAAEAEPDASCASCGLPCSSLAGLWQTKRKEDDGPLHCAACWGDYEDVLPPNLPAARARWWHTTQVKRWLGLSAPFAESRHSIAGEVFIAITPSARDIDAGPFPGVGSTRPWPASKRLTLYLAKHAHELLPSRGVVIEVGAGACPLPGMWLARHTDARVCLTDLPSLLPLIELNVEANFGDGRVATRSPEVVPLRWGCRADLESDALPRRADLVLAADVVYFASDVASLFGTLEALGAPIMLVALMPRDQQNEHYDVLVEEAAASRGWACTRVVAVDDPMLSACMLFELRAAQQLSSQLPTTAPARPSRQRTWTVITRVVVASMIVGVACVAACRGSRRFYSLF
mmetsp:Transcript_25524/g.64891  ORF Transcript_25524/g.64891 Transcript_25524/m.64891 type:complete len:364 (+) Transcript_25524:104-1195(+)